MKRLVLRFAITVTFDSRKLGGCPPGIVAGSLEHEREPLLSHLCIAVQNCKIGGLSP